MALGVIETPSGAATTASEPRSKTRSNARKPSKSNLAAPNSPILMLSSKPNSRAASPARGAEEGLFERDVEFSSDHLLNAQEATDVAIPPILQEAATVLTNDELPNETLDSLVRVVSSSAIASLNSPMSEGFAMPITHDLSPTHSLTSVPTRSTSNLSPTRSDGGYGGYGGHYRAVSPSSMHYLSSSPPDSVLTPSTSPSPPQHPAADGKLALKQSTGIAFSLLPEDNVCSVSNSPLSLGIGGYSRDFGLGLPSTTEGSVSPISLPPAAHVDSIGETMHPAQLAVERKARRLSFMSYADIINSERADQHNASSGPASSPALQTAMDMRQIWDALPEKEETGDHEHEARGRSLS